MATASPKVTPQKPRPNKRSSTTPGNTERLKVVVRRLPPNLPEDVFWQSVQEWVTDETVSWKSFYAGKFRKRLNAENIPSRAYIAFKDDAQLALFSREYDGHLFRDKAGVESQAVVEFAPYQKIPTEKSVKPDKRSGTIEQDEDYMSFVASLTASKDANEPVSIETLLAATQPIDQPKTTPLLEALKAQKAKEAIQRNHAHYNRDSGGPKSIASKAGPGGGKAAPGAPKSAASKASAPGSSSKPDGGSKKEKKKGAAPANAPPKPQQPQPAQAQADTGGAPSRRAAKKAAKAAQAQSVAGASTATPKASAPATPITIAKPPLPNTGPPPNAPRQPRAARQQPAQTPGTPSTASAALPPASAPPPRRGRPVVGLASRQFEAALSGAGAARKKPEGAPNTTNPSAAPSAPSHPHSPVIAVPQAPRILARPTDSQAPSEGAPPPPAGEGARGGARRGRGRGRGAPRGGQPGGG